MINVTSNLTNISPYPCIKIRQKTGLVLLLDRENCGTVIKEADSKECCADNYYKLGEYSNSWQESLLHSVTGKITLKNS